MFVCVCVCIRQTNGKRQFWTETTGFRSIRSIRSMSTNRWPILWWKVKYSYKPMKFFWHIFTCNNLYWHRIKMMMRWQSFEYAENGIYPIAYFNRTHSWKSSKLNGTLNQLIMHAIQFVQQCLLLSKNAGIIYIFMNRLYRLDRKNRCVFHQNWRIFINNSIYGLFFISFFKWITFKFVGIKVEQTEMGWIFGNCACLKFNWLVIYIFIYIGAIC